MSLKIKQISDFITGVEAINNAQVGTASVTAIGVVQSDVNLNQANIEAALSTELVNRIAADGTLTTNLSTEVARALAAEGVNAGAIATEATRALAAEGVLSGNISAVDVKVTTLLGGSTDALDTFGEIKTFIDALSAEDVTTIAALSTSLSNDIAQAADIATNVSNISTNATGISTNASNITSGDAATLSDAKVYTDAAELAAVSAAGLASIAYSDSRDVVTLASAATAATSYTDGRESAITTAYEAYADAAESGAIASANSYANGLAVNYATAAQGILADAAATQVDLTTAEGRLDSLEGYIMEDNEMFVETFVGNAYIYEVANLVQDFNPRLVDAFVNGHRVEVLTAVASGTPGKTNIALANPGYSIDSGDSVVISYQGE